jgi:hypothetical protein
VCGNPEKAACSSEGEQQPRVSGIGVRVERPVDQLRLDELLDLCLPPDRRVGAGERCEQLAVVWNCGTDMPSGVAHPSIVTGTMIRNG